MNWQQLSEASLEEIITWAETQGWCHAMADCGQDPQWHAEGDVWTHTKMVLQQLEILPEWDDLAREQQTILIFTAIFHDVGKPVTTIVDSNGRVRSPKHAIKGEHITRKVLRDLGCDVRTREQIARLVRYHGRPAFLTERERPTNEVVRLSWLVSNKLLYLFALADTRGRSTKETTKPEDNLHFWKMLSEEANCYQQPYAFATDHARFTFIRQAEPNLHYVPHENFCCQVTIMAGLPGSGKDTWLANQRPELPVVSLDNIRNQLGIDPTENQGQVAQAAKSECQKWLRSRTSFAFNATNILRQNRQRWIDLFADYNARIEIVYLEPELDVILKQNRSRDRKVPESVIQRLADKCEPPNWLECHQFLLNGFDLKDASSI